MFKPSNIVTSLTLAIACLISQHAMAGTLPGTSPAGATDFHIKLANPVDLTGGAFDSTPFGYPVYDPNDPNVTVIDFKGSAIGAGVSFNLANFTFVPTNNPPPGALQVLETWWTFDDTQVGIKQDYSGPESIRYYLVRDVPEPGIHALLFSGLAIVFIRKKHALNSKLNPFDKKMASKE